MFTFVKVMFSVTELDSPAELEKKRICRIVTRDFPQYFAVVSRIKQESNHMGPDGGLLSSSTVPMVQASFPQGALTKRIRVGLQVQQDSLDQLKFNLFHDSAYYYLFKPDPLLVEYLIMPHMPGPLNFIESSGKV